MLAGITEPTTQPPMQLFVRLLLLSLLLPLGLSAQSAGFRAQGRYYSAKEAFESNRFADAAQLLRESRDFLGGKSNIRLQYLLVRSLHSAGKYQEAQKEMAVFFNISDAKGEERAKIYQNYPQDVDQLTSDETREISIMIDKIDREVAAGTEAKNAVAAQAAAKEVRRREAFEALQAVILKRFITKRTGLPGPNGFSDTEAEISVSGSYNAMTVSFRSVMYTNLGNSRRKPHQRYEQTITFDLRRLTTYSMLPSNEAAYYMVPVDHTAHFGRLNFSYQVTGRYADQQYDTGDFKLVNSNAYDASGPSTSFPVTSPQAFEAAMRKVKAAQ